MNHFDYKSETLHCEDVSLAALAAAVGTPAYVYSTATLAHHIAVFRAALAPLTPLIAFAVKANANVAVLATLAAHGAGADTVSAGEIKRALRAGVPADKIVFSGVGKTQDELDFALAERIGQINVESRAELDMVEACAARIGVRAPIALRVNPDVAAGGHDKISTGGAEAKFGIGVEETRALYRRLGMHAHIAPRGLAIHIGSQIKALAPLERAFTVIRDLVIDLRAEGLPVPFVDLGGGLGAPYFNEPDPPAPSDYGALVKHIFAGVDIGFIFEPGRLIAANAGLLLARVIRIQARPTRRILVLDAGMNDLVRPAIYDAFHEVRPVIEPNAAAPREPVDIVGPICETGDTFARARATTPLGAGDLVAIMTAGAYGAVMASTYNARDLVPEILVSGGKYEVVRRRWTVDEQIAIERAPAWLTAL